MTIGSGAKLPSIKIPVQYEARINKQTVNTRLTSTHVTVTNTSKTSHSAQPLR